MILIDTNIFIEIFRDNLKVIEFFDTLNKNELAISIITYAELIFGARNKVEKQMIEKHLSGLHIFHLDNNISIIFIKLIKDYCLSHKLNIPDALIASSAISSNSTLLTLNVKDFHYIPELRLLKI